MVKQLYYSKIHSKNIEIYLSKLYTGKYSKARNFPGLLIFVVFVVVSKSTKFKN